MRYVNFIAELIGKSQNYSEVAKKLFNTEVKFTEEQLSLFSLQSDKSIEQMKWRQYNA